MEEEEILPSALKRSGLRRGRVTRDDIHHALAHQVCIPFEWEADNEPVLMHIGSRADGAYIEVGKSEDSTGVWRIVHAMHLRRRFYSYLPGG
jgi:hypothetical protein